jgi:hypothetical protein
MTIHLLIKQCHIQEAYLTMRTLFLCCALLIITTLPSAAALKVIGKGNQMQIDVSSYPSKMKERYLIMKVKCVQCHTMERTIVALQTGVAPISGQLFDKSAAKAYGIKMMRKPDARMTREDVKEIVELLYFLQVEAEKH